MNWPYNWCCFGRGMRGIKEKYLKFYHKHIARSNIQLCYENAGCLLLAYIIDRTRLQPTTLDYSELASFLRLERDVIFQDDPEEAKRVIRAVDKVQEVWSRWEVALHDRPIFISDMKCMFNLAECLGMHDIAKLMSHFVCDARANVTGLHIPPEHHMEKWSSKKKKQHFVPRQNRILPTWK